MRWLVGLSLVGLGLVAAALWFARREQAPARTWPLSGDPRVQASREGEPQELPGVDEPATARAQAPTGSAAGAQEPHVLVGRCLDLAGEPLVQVLVLGTARVEGETRTDERGRFELPFDPEPLARRSGQLQLSRRDLASETLTPPRGATGRVDLGAATLARGGTLRGRVLSSDGLPTPGARVRAEGDRDAARVRGSALSDELGAWSIPGLPHGGYEVTARLLGASEDEPLRPVISSEVCEAGDLRLRPIDEQALLRGAVYGTTGLAQAEAHLTFRKLGGSPSHRGSMSVDARGRFVIAGAPGARYGLFGNDPDSNELTELVEADCGEAEVGLRLRRLARVELLVVDAEGLPVTEFGWRVSASASEGWYGTGAPIEPHVGGVARIPLLQQPFDLRVHARSYERLDLGAIDPAAVGERLKVELQRSPSEER